MTVPSFTMVDLMEILITKAGLPRDAVTDDKGGTLADLGLDSLALLQLSAEIADRYGVEIDDERPEATLGELLAFINKGLSEHAR